MPPTEATGPTSKSNVRKRSASGKLRKLLVICAIALPVVLLLLNGPGFRAIGEFAAKKGAATQGLIGSLKIEGTIWSGFSIKDVKFSGGTDIVKSVEVEELAVSYSFPGIITGAAELNWLNAVVLKNATVEINLPEATEKEKVEKEPKEKPTEYATFWNLLGTDIDIENVTLSLTQADKVQSFEEISLRSEPGRDGTFSISSIKLPDQEPVEDITANLVKGERSLRIESIHLEDVASLKFLAVSEPTPGGFHADAEVEYASGTLQAAFDVSGEASIGLRSGTSIDLSKIAPQAGGKVTDFGLSFSGAFDTPSTWDIKGNVVASGLAWEGAKIDTLALVIAENALKLDALESSAKLRLTASAPLDRIGKIEQLATMPVDLSLDLKIDSIEQLLGELAEKIPATGAFEAKAQNFQLVGGTRIQSGSFLAKSETLAWDGMAIDTLQLAANVESANVVRIGTEVRLDADNHLRLSGVFNTESLTYEADASANVAASGAVSDLVEGFEGGASLGWNGSGDLKGPLHQGSAAIDISSVKIAEGQPFDGSVSISYEDTTVALSELSLVCGDVSLSGTGNWNGERAALSDLILKRGDHEALTLNAEVPLGPTDEGGFLGQSGPLSLGLTANELRTGDITRFFSPTPPAPGALSGNLNGSGTFQEIALDGDFKFTPQFEGATENSLLTLQLGLGGDVARPESWDAKLDAVLSGLQFQEVDIQNISLGARTQTSPTGKALVAEVKADQSSARLVANAQLMLEGADSFAALAERPLELNLDLNAADVGQVWKDFAPGNLSGFPVSGELSAKITDFRLEQGSMTRGIVSVASDTLTVADGSFEKIAIDATIPEPDFLDSKIAVILDEASRISGNVQFHVKEQTYAGDVNVAANLGTDGELKDLLGGREIALLLPKMTSLVWMGSGDIKGETHRGKVDLNADSVTLAEGGEALDVALSGEYSESSADFPVIELKSRPLTIDGALSWKENRLVLNNWKGQANSREFLSINGSIPLDPEKLKPEAWFAQEAPMELALNLDALPLATVFELLGGKPPVQGVISVNLDAKGTPAKPALSTDLAFNEIIVPQEKKAFQAGDLELSLVAKDAAAKLDGAFRHPDTNPLTVSASLPFHPGGWATGARKIVDEPIELTAKMADSSLAFLPSQVPAIEAISGTIGLNAAIGGTIAAPEISGSGKLDVDRLRLDNRNAPSFYDIDLLARFADNRITIDKLYAIVAGGVVEGSGNAVFAPGEEPVFDFSLSGSEVLVVRTPDVNVRTDASLTLKGPFSQARIAGEVGITNSRFFKNVDLMPIGLPTRNKSVLPTVERTPRGGGPATADLDFGVKDEPFNNWPIDVRIYTKDPFLIRGNLAQSALNLDIRIGGTLGVLSPVGYLEIAEGELSLPFSSVEVEVGRVEFDQSTGFNGAIELKAIAKADKYRINAYVYDHVLTPKFVLTSIPPMPSEDIMTLLVTGTTRNALVGGDAGSVAASKAATLFFKNLRKESATADGEPSLLDSLQERTEFELGRVNPETGQQTVAGRIRLWKQLFFVGDVDTDSDYRAALKYVFSFR